MLLQGRNLEVRRQLTSREQEIVKLLCEECLDTKEISDRLCLSDKTVGTHRANIYDKLGFSRMSELCRWYWAKK